MDDWEGLTRRQQIWLLDRQVEGIVQAVAATIAAATQPKPADSQARRQLEERIGLQSGSLAAVRVATRLMTPGEAAAVERAMGLGAGKIHPVREMPKHEDLPHPDLGGLRLWEGEVPTDEGTLPSSVAAPILSAAFGLPGRDRTLISRASGLDQTVLSRMTSARSGACSRANLRILAYVLGLSPKIFGLGGSGNQEPNVARPDMRHYVGSSGITGGITSSLGASSAAYGRIDTLVPAPANDILELTDPMIDAAEGRMMLKDDDADAWREHSVFRSIDICESRFVTRPPGILYIRQNDGTSTLSILGRMTSGRLRCIASAMGTQYDAVASDKDVVIADVCQTMEDAVIERGYAALTAPAPKRRRGLLGLSA